MTSLASSTCGDAETATVLILAPLRIYRESLAALIQHRGGFHVDATASLSDGATLALQSPPDVVLLDMTMPESLGTVRAIKDATPGARMVAMGVAECAEDVVQSASAGIIGFLPLEASVEDLITALNEATRGDVFCTPGVAAAVVAHLVSMDGSRSADTHLTPREREIINLLELGLSNKEIARRLAIEIPTVKNHVHHILRKLHVSGRGQVAAHARRRGLVT